LTNVKIKLANQFTSNRHVKHFVSAKGNFIFIIRKEGSDRINRDLSKKSSHFSTISECKYMKEM